MGDFNILIDDMNNNYANTYLRAMEFLGLDQHVTFSTHNKWHTLDCVFTESGSKTINSKREYIKSHQNTDEV